MRRAAGGRWIALEHGTTYFLDEGRADGVPLVLLHGASAVAAAVAAARPEALQRLVLVAPMLDFAATSAWVRMLKRRVIGDFLARFVALPMLLRRRKARYVAIGQPQLTERFREQIAHDGFRQALLSMVRCGTLGDQARRYAVLAETAHDVLVVAGTADRVSTLEDAARVQSLLRRGRLCAVQGAEHSLLLTHCPPIAAAISAFVRAP